jgi:hypothetical protein
MFKTQCDCVFHSYFLKFSLCITWRAFPHPQHHPPTSTVNLASDWLGVDLEVRSLCYKPTPQTGNQRTEE